MRQNNGIREEETPNNMFFQMIFLRFKSNDKIFLNYNNITQI